MDPISCSLYSESQEFWEISWKDSQNSEAVVLMAMVYYSEKMHNNICKGKDTLTQSLGK